MGCSWCGGFAWRIIIPGVQSAIESSEIKWNYEVEKYVMILVVSNTDNKKAVKSPIV